MKSPQIPLGRALRLCVLTCLGCLSTVRALTISEILPENEGLLKDADDESPGWIEIRNDTATPVNLAGWRLTDDPALPAKWTFPAQNLGAGAYLVVFASGKDRAVAGQELHTNFKLDPDGEYLALVRPEGTVAAEFAPEYPKLRRNISHAVTVSDVVQPLTTEAATVRYLVPTDGSLGTAWTAPGFADGAWSTGNGPLGFDTAASGAQIDLKTNSSATSLPAPSGWTGFAFAPVPESGAGSVTTATTTVGGLTVKIDAVGASVTLSSRNREGGATDVINDSASLNNVAEDFIYANASTYTAGSPKGLNITVSGLTPDTSYAVRLWGYDSVSSSNRSTVWTDATGGDSATLTFNGASGTLANDAALDERSVDLTAVSNASGQIVLQGRAGSAGSTSSHNVFVSALRIGSPSFGSVIGTAVTGMQGTARSCFTRSSFTVANPALYNRLRLRVRYDDGFVAWLNGQPLASRNAPGSPAWNSSATADRPKASALATEEIEVPLTAGMLVAGANVLAVQGLSQGAADTDFLLGVTADAIGLASAQPLYFATPTPGAANAQGFPGFVGDTTFTVDRGFYSTPQSVEIACATPGAQIRWTLDGSAPTATTGTPYTGPIPVTGTTVLRAAAFVPGLIPSNVDTQTYLFVSDIATQPAAPAGWPTTWGTDSEVSSNNGGNGTVPADYEMDPAVTANTVPGKSAEEALLALPAMCISMAPSDFLGTSGIYQNPRSTGAAWERACSVEFIDPSGAEKGFAETCGIKVHGNSSRRPWRVQKHGFGLEFRGSLGASSLRYRLFPDSKVDKFDELVLRASFTDGWCLVSWDPGRYRPDDSLQFRDVWAKNAHRDMGYLATRNRFVHLFINGLYWGIYNPCEHIDEKMLASQLGGLETDWEVVADFVDPDSSATSRWKTMFNLVNAGVASDAAYQQVLQHLDPASFIDYYMLHVHIESEDWPHHNGYAYRSKVVPGARYQWMTWDQEIMFDNHAIDRLSTGAGNTGTDRTPGRLYQQLKANAEFRLLFADRAHKHFHNGGALSLARSQDRWQALADGLDTAIVAESARWGDTADATPYGNAVSKPVFTREGDWLPTVANVRNTWLPALHNEANAYATIRKLKAANLYPSTEPPSFAQFGGTVAPGYALAMTAPAGQIHYTLDGTDPRQAVTGAAVGTTYAGAVPLTQTGTVKARALNAGVWSALTEATFIVGVAADASNLVISELNYEPLGNPLEEFVELTNVGAVTIDLTGVTFTAGIAFTFPEGFTLAPGARTVVVRDAAAFAARHPAVVPAGQYTGALDNNGETLTLIAADGSFIASFRFNDGGNWPPGAAGGGSTLTLVAPATHPDPADPASWRHSVAEGGSPGASDAVAYTVGDPLAYAQVSRVELEWDAPLAAWTVNFSRLEQADDADVAVETSTDCAAWSRLAFAERLATSPDGPLVRERWIIDAADAPRAFVRLRATVRQP